MLQRGYVTFFQRLFCPTVPKISLGEAFSVEIISGVEKVSIRGGGGGSIKIFR